MKKINKIQIASPSIGKEEIKSVVDCINSKWITQGPRVKSFEYNFSRYHKARYGIAVTSCTTGLHLILKTLNLKKEDEVIVPSFTWISTANVVEYCGAKLILADNDEETNNISEEDLLKKITKKTKAIIIVHLFGNVFDVSKLKKKIPKRIKIIEDCACSAGAKINNKFTGTLGYAGCFSFHPRKIISTGEGGMILTNSKKLALKLVKLRNHGAELSEEKRHKSKNPFILPKFKILGFNYRMTDIHGAIGVEQTKKLKFLLQERKKWSNYYFKKLKNLNIFKLPAITKNSTHGWQSFVLHYNLKKAKKSLTEIMKILETKKISVRMGTHAIHNLEYYKKKYNYKKLHFPGAEYCEKNSIAIPLHNNMNSKDYEYIVNIILNLDKQYSARFRIQKT